MARLLSEKFDKTLHVANLAGNEVEVLKAEGFISSEIRDLLKGLTIDIDSDAVVHFRKGRIEWWNGLRRNGWTNSQIGRSLHKFYRDTNATIFDDFRSQYIIKQKFLTPTEYRAALAKRKRSIKITRPMYRLLKTKPGQRPSYRPGDPVDVTIKGKKIRF